MCWLNSTEGVAQLERHEEKRDVDRDFAEILQELRVVQTGGQLFFAFLFGVAFTPVFKELNDGQRSLYGWTLFVVASAITVLVAPVAFHRWNFRQGMRPQLVFVTHVFASFGIALLAIGIVMGMLLVSSVVFPDSTPWLAIGSAVLAAVAWIVVPLVLRVTGATERPSS